MSHVLKKVWHQKHHLQSMLIPASFRWIHVSSPLFGADSPAKLGKLVARLRSKPRTELRPNPRHGYPRCDLWKLARSGSAPLRASGEALRRLFAGRSLVQSPRSSSGQSAAVFGSDDSLVHSERNTTPRSVSAPPVIRRNPNSHSSASDSFAAVMALDGADVGAVAQFLADLAETAVRSPGQCTESTADSAVRAAGWLNGVARIKTVQPCGLHWLSSLAASGSQSSGRRKHKDYVVDEDLESQAVEGGVDWAMQVQR